MLHEATGNCVKTSFVFVIVAKFISDKIQEQVMEFHVKRMVKITDISKILEGNFRREGKT
jgi:hypothetical protein